MKRIAAIQVFDFKNVKKGELEFKNNENYPYGSVLGLYGQNGSGKTALIDVLDLIKTILCGQKISSDFLNMIHVDAEYSRIVVQFTMDEKERHSEIEYSFKLNRSCIYDEILSYAYTDGETRVVKSKLIDTSNSPTFSPVSKCKSLIGTSKENDLNVMAIKKMVRKEFRSFIFSSEFLEVVRNRNNECKDEEFMRHMYILESLVDFANYELFVVKSKCCIDDSMVLSKSALDVYKRKIESMNRVLPYLVPNLTMGVKVLGKELMRDSSVGYRVELVSNKIPFKYESDGVKRIVSILQPLIEIFNNTSVVVAIDDLDCGIHEYLFGEIVKMMSEQAKGQLIFTAHNLRPMEIINKKFLVFTTTDPDNRYVRYKNIAAHNNLRDVYLRDIALSDFVKSAEISYGLRKAKG